MLWVANDNPPSHFHSGFVHSYDLRNSVEKNRRWSNRTVFAGRADFAPGQRPAVLTLRPGKRSDEAIYRCRVDFRLSPTRNQRTRLQVVGESVGWGSVSPVASKGWEMALCVREPFIDENGICNVLSD